MLHSTGGITLATHLLQKKESLPEALKFVRCFTNYINQCTVSANEILIFLSYMAFILGEAEEQQNGILLHTTCL
jgi:pyruvate-formate lyase-activating enzyme